MIKIYIYGCECGVNGHLVRRVKAYGLQSGVSIEVFNTKYDVERRQEHDDYLKTAGLRRDYLLPIVVQDGIVEELRKWKS